MLSYAATARAAFVSIIAAGNLIGCAEYVDRKDTIAFSAGNAVQTNIVTHVTDPWPPSSRNKNFAVNGQRMQRAIENYRCGTIPGEANSNGNDGGSNMGGNAASSPGGKDAC
ncbi:hypothetical protein [Microvirga brassicacearum]|uniref:Uncharacterized protein n=1 Tax=Microvirga brassicacearum TaxID=2580413 RepID=A0A5N3P7R9_9HYPH|nr:hypothetical protein [Microvirga brassicacearum]KAB0265766.1 hypothetical protein FEZ63_17325 [Microvirga brassicacearum]